jgi:hypothetical protein
MPVNSAASIFNNMIIHFCSYVFQTLRMTRLTQLGHNLTKTKISGTEQMVVASGNMTYVLFNSHNHDNTNEMHTSGAILYRHLQPGQGL